MVLLQKILHPALEWIWGLSVLFYLLSLELKLQYSFCFSSQGCHMQKAHFCVSCSLKEVHHYSKSKVEENYNPVVQSLCPHY